MTLSHADNLNLSNFKEDSQIIQDIVQKFILIPKSHTISEVNVDQQKQEEAQRKSVTDDIHWKSKYDILNQLVENERDEPTKFVTAPNEIPTKDIKEQSMKDTNESNRYLTTHLTQSDVYSEKSIPMQLNQGLRETVKCDIDDQFKTVGTSEKNVSNLAPKSVHRDTNIKNFSKGHASDSSNELLNTQNDDDTQSLKYENNNYQRTQESSGKDKAKMEFLQDNGLSSIERKPPIEATSEFNNPMQQYTENNEQSESMQYPINIINTETFMPNDGVILEDGVNINPKVYEGNEQFERTQYPLEVLNSEEFPPNDDIVLDEDRGNVNYEGYDESELSQRMQYPIHDINPEEFTSNDGVAIEDTVNTNPEGYEGATNYDIITLSHQSGGIVDPVLGQAEIEENAAVAKGIEEFEAEQSDMWHESPGENVAYSQEAYEQPNQYYYEQKQEYPVDVNEHEETQLNYDQSYQQQYVNQYEAEYQQETQQYDQSQAYEGYEQNYEALPVYNEGGYNEEESNQHQIHGTPQTIEQELDKEQGFVEKNVEEKEAPDINALESPPNTGVDQVEIK